MHDIYQQLAQHLDNSPGGFSAAPNGLEIRILQRLFTPLEARMAKVLTLLPESPDVIAAKLYMDRNAIDSSLQQMARKGLIFR